MPRNRDQELLREVGQRVSRARRDRGWSQEQLAEAIDIQPTTLSRLETGDRAISLSTLGRVAEALGVGLGDLLDVKRDLPTIEHGPEHAELLRGFDALSAGRRELVLRLVRELA